jgi:hypothetical protein
MSNSIILSLAEYKISMVESTKFFNKISRLIKNINFSFELYFWNETIKKLYRKYHMPKNSLNVCLETRKNVLIWVNDPESKYSLESDSSPKSLFIPEIANRVFELNEEFPTLIKMRCFHSANAITRQVIDLYIRTLYCRHDPSVIKSLFVESDEGFPRTPDMNETLKNSEIDLPYLKQVMNLSNKKQFTKKEFLDIVHSDFKYFSEKAHPTLESFAHNTWVVERDSNNKVKSVGFYKDSQEKIKNENIDIIHFTKYSNNQKEGIQNMFRTFFFYSALILMELSLINEKNKMLKV